jgi:hypothetical protein
MRPKIREPLLNAKLCGSDEFTCGTVPETTELDCIGSTGLSGWAKAGWCIVIVFLPFLGTLIYYITRAA